MHIADAAKAPQFSSASELRAQGVNSGYAWYVLGVLMLVYLFNYLDRAILGILAEDVKRALNISDSELGFLYGTAFGIFYALFGYPLGRLVDRCRRIPLLSIGMFFWSAMTCVCGLSSNFAQLAVARVGVGIGEAIASPASYSLMSDWFSREKRGTAFGIYASGMYLGAGLSLAIGGMIVHAWNTTFAGGEAPLGLAGWQAAFIAVGLPGILLAIWVFTLREPARGMADNIAAPPETNVLRKLFDDLCSVVPPFTLIAAYSGGPRYLVNNIAAALAFAALGWVAIALSGDVLQWATLAVGCYAVFSSCQSLRKADPPTFALTWGSRTFVYTIVGFSCISMMNVTISFWVAPLALRNFEIDKGTAGLFLGIISAVAGLCGVILGGRISDALLRITPFARIWVGLASAVTPVPFLFLMTRTRDLTTFFICDVPIILIGNAWIAAGAATVQELVLPRMRGTASAIYLLAISVIGLGLGPYTVGKASTMLGGLSDGILFALISVPVAIVCLICLARGLVAAEAGKIERARRAGEVILPA